MKKKDLTPVQVQAREIFAAYFSYKSPDEMREAVANARDKEVNRYKKAQKEDGVDYATRSKTYASCPSLLIMVEYPHGADRLDCMDPTYLKSVSAISKNEIIRHIEYVLESRQKNDALKYGFTIAVDAQLYYYEQANDRLQGIPAEPTSEYYSIDIFHYPGSEATTKPKEFDEDAEKDFHDFEHPVTVDENDEPVVSNARQIMLEAESNTNNNIVLEISNDQRMTLGELVRMQIESCRDDLRRETEAGWHYIIIDHLTHYRNILKSLNTI